MSSTAVPSETELARALEVTNFLSKEDVRRRAHLLHQELTRLQIEGFRLRPVQTYPGNSTRPEIRVSEYEFGPVSFGLENAKDPMNVRRTVEEMAGTAIDREDILYLSKICEMAHRLIPNLWKSDRKLLRNVKIPTQHLDTLNEIWWLGRWAGLDEKFLEHEVSVAPGSGKTIDWRFQLSGVDLSWAINVEVKRLISSIGRRAYGKDHYFYAALRADDSANKDDPRLKFKASSEDEVNVLAVTWFDEISPQLETEIQRFLDEDDRVDCVTIWAPGDRRRGGWMRFFPRFRDIPKKRQIISSLLVDPDEEDKARIIAFMFPRTLASIQAEMNAV